MAFVPAGSQRLYKKSLGRGVDKLDRREGVGQADGSGR